MAKGSDLSSKDCRFESCLVHYVVSLGKMLYLSCLSPPRNFTGTCVGNLPFGAVVSGGHLKDCPLEILSLTKGNIYLKRFDSLVIKCYIKNQNIIICCKK